MSNNSIPRMRTIKECAKHIQSEDPNSAVTEYFIRTLANTNAIMHVRAGKKILIDIDSLIDFLKGGVTDG